MNYLFEVAAVLFACLLVYIFFNGWFGTRTRNRSRVAFYMASYFLLHSIVALPPLDPVLRAAISFFLVLGIACALYETTLPSALYSSLIYMALAVLSEYFSLVLLNMLSFDTATLMQGGNARAILLALAKTVHFAAVVIAAAVLRKNRAALTFKQVAPLLPCLVVGIYICIVFFTLFAGHDESLSSMLVMALIGLLYINGVIVLNTQAIKSAVFENEEQRLAGQHYEMQIRYYRNVLKGREEAHALRHDLKRHITAIEALVGSKDNKQAENEYRRIRQAVDELGGFVDIENPALNAILYHSIDQANSHNISVSLDAHVPSEFTVSAVDLSVIIGNTFDNAIEECVTLAEVDTRINVTLVQQNHMLFYEITNPCMPIPHEKAGKYRGYGLGNVRRCVEKYGGSMEQGMKDGIYRVSIRLNCS